MPPDPRLARKVAVVTGAGRAIGRAEAIAFAQQGANLIVADMGKDETGRHTAEIVADEIVCGGGTAVAATQDISTEDGARACVEIALAAFGRLDILVNNAGLRAANPVDQLSEKQ
jgi:NAD(P)-dependent dehydrogenase (short-subunit alcohol dehydrogenase family)